MITLMNARITTWITFPGRGRKMRLRSYSRVISEQRTLDDESWQRTVYAVIRNALWESGTPIPANDIWIAATAMQYGLRSSVRNSARTTQTPSATSGTKRPRTRDECCWE